MLHTCVHGYLAPDKREAASLVVFYVSLNCSKREGVFQASRWMWSSSKVTHLDPHPKSTVTLCRLEGLQFYVMHQNRQIATSVLQISKGERPGTSQRTLKRISKLEARVQELVATSREQRGPRRRINTTTSRPADQIHEVGRHTPMSQLLLSGIFSKTISPTPKMMQA